MTRSQKSELKKYVEISKDELRSGPGKPISLTWDMLVRMKAMLFEGQFQKTVYMYFNINKNTWDDWRRKGKEVQKQIQNKKKKLDKLNESERKYLYLDYLCYIGRSHAIEKHHNIVSRSASNDWKASKWFLEVFAKDDYGQKIEVDMNATITMEDLLEETED